MSYLWIAVIVVLVAIALLSFPLFRRRSKKISTPDQLDRVKSAHRQIQLEEHRQQWIKNASRASVAREEQLASEARHREEKRLQNLNP